MKYSFIGQHIQVTAENLEDNVLLMGLMTEQPTKKPKTINASERAKKGWETKRKNGTTVRGGGFIAPDGSHWKSRGNYNKSLAAKKRVANTPPEVMAATIERLKRARQNAVYAN